MASLYSEGAKAFINSFTKLMRAKGRAGASKREPLTNKLSRLNIVLKKLSEAYEKTGGKAAKSSILRTWSRVQEQKQGLTQAEKSLKSFGVGKNINN